MVREDQNGWLYFMFRKGSGIRRNGEFINAAFIEKVIAEAPAKRDALQASLDGGSLDERAQATATKALAKLDADVTKAQDDLVKNADKTTSLVGLEEPLIKLKNPGLISIPLGFLAVFLGSLLYIATYVLIDVAYTLADPRVRMQ